MTNCDIIPINNKACSGKCKGGGCSTKSNVWVIAACGGVVAVFHKQANGNLVPVMDGSNVSALAEDLCERLMLALERAEFSQIVLVGSANDIAWTQALLPSSISKHVVAEIKYPLISQWFSYPSEERKLVNALENVFK